MFAAIGSAFTNGRFSMDVIVHKSDGNSIHVLSMAGTECTLYLKHGFFGSVNTIETPGGIDVLPSGEAAYSWSTAHWYSFFFPEDYNVNIAMPTWFYTSCSDSLLVDTFHLEDEEENGQYFGGNGQYAWCLSTDASQFDEVNNAANSLVSGWTPLSGNCYRHLMLLPIGQYGKVYGWRGSSQGYAYAQDGRRALQEALPTDADVRACEQDEATTAADCSALVEQILTFQMAHHDGYELAEHITPLDNLRRKL